MEICLIRHTTPEVAKGVCYGQTDLQLASSYPDELQAVKTRLSGGFGQVYSSPLQRCSRLAKDLFREEKIMYDDRLKELNFGAWEMVSWKDMDRDLQNQWMANFVEIAPPEGESLQQLSDRVRDFLNMLKGNNFDRVALVTHSGVIRVIRTLVHGTALAECFNYQLDYGYVEHLRF